MRYYPFLMGRGKEIRSALERKKELWVGVCLGAGTSVLVALLTGGGCIPRFSIVILVVLGSIFFIGAFVGLGLMGGRLRPIFLSAAVCIVMIAVGRSVWTVGQTVRMEFRNITHVDAKDIDGRLGYNVTYSNASDLEAESVGGFCRLYVETIGVSDIAANDAVTKFKHEWVEAMKDRPNIMPPLGPHKSLTMQTCETELSEKQLTDAHVPVYLVGAVSWQHDGYHETHICHWIMPHTMWMTCGIWEDNF